MVVSVTLTDSRLRLSAITSHNDRGKTTHNFVIGIVHSPSIKPGGNPHLVAHFPDCGRYRFACTLHCGTALHGFFSRNR